MSLSLGKLLLLAVVIAAIWIGYRMVQASQRGRMAGRRDAAFGRSRGRPHVVDLERNPKSGAYEPRERDNRG